MKKSQTRRLMIPALLAGIGLALAACGGPGEVMAPQQPAPARTDAGSAPPSGEGAPAGSTEVTKPGTALKLGDRAITHTAARTTSDGEITTITFETIVTTIEAGDAAGFDKLRATEKGQAKGMNPFYVHMTHKVTGLEGPDGGILIPKIEGLLSGGSKAASLFTFSEFPGCRPGLALKAEVGKTVEDCVVALAPLGTSVSGARWIDDRWNYERYDDNPYRDSPVTWES